MNSKKKTNNEEPVATSSVLTFALYVSRSMRGREKRVKKYV